MNDKLNKPKRFGEILDTAFQVSKKYFSRFFLMLLIIVGPVYLLKNIFFTFFGKRLMTDTYSQEGWLDRLRNGSYLEEDTNGAESAIDFLFGIPEIVLTAVAFAAVLFAINHMRKNNDFVVGAMIKQAFSKFWKILGSSLLFGLIVIGITAAAIIFASIFSIISGVGSIVVGVFMVFVLMLGAGLLVAYLLTRWSLFLGLTVFEDDIPGFGASWHLTRQSVWKTMGVYLVFSLIFFSIRSGLNVIILPVLGESVLYYIIFDLISLLTSTIFAVGYAIVYFDIKSRYDGDDLSDMLDDYEAMNNES